MAPSTGDFTSATRSRRFYVVGFLALMCFDTFAQVSFKYAALGAQPFAPEAAWLWRVLSGPWIYVAIGCYVATFFTWMTLLTHAPIGPAYAASHLEIISVLLLSAVLFHEPVHAPQILGCLLIVLGILTLAHGASRAQRRSDRPRSPAPLHR